MATTDATETSTSPDRSPALRRLILLGNPNVGKSVVFGRLTGNYVTVSNYPGTTVEITSGRSHHFGDQVEVLDTPGTNSLVPQSEDERVARDVLLADHEATVLQVADAKNLGRALTLLFQVAEVGRPMVLALNMVDEAGDRGLRVDHRALAAALGIPVVPTVAPRGDGIAELLRSVAEARPATIRVDYGAAVEGAVAEIAGMLPGLGPRARAVALLALGGDDQLGALLAGRLDATALERIETIRRRAAGQHGDPLPVVLQRARQAAAERLLAAVSSRPARRPGGVREALGRWAMHPIGGIPVLLAVLALAYVLVGRLGAGTLVDLLEDGLFNTWINPIAIRAVDAVTPFPHSHETLEGGGVATAYALAAPGAAATFWQSLARAAHDLLVGDYGVVTMALTYSVAIVLPVVGTFFLFFGLLEDSGYLPRLTIMVDRLFRVIGLNGKAVLPMVLGLGCDTMATLTTRILESKKERIVVTLLLALSIPCSAQLGVIVAMLSGISAAGALIWLGCVLGSILVVGLLARLVIPGEASDFILEIPPIRWPRIGNLVPKTAARMEWYLREAVPLFALGTVLLFVLDRTGLLRIAVVVSRPVVSGLLGLPPEATQAFLVGFLRRDYGAAGLFALQRAGHLDPAQVVISLVTITLFLPCIANFFMMWKERGPRTSLAMAAFVIPFAFLTGALVRWFIAVTGITL